MTSLLGPQTTLDNLAGNFSVISGRELVWAPSWQCSDARVVFDRNSGDYWVVSGLASLLLETVQNFPGAHVLQIKRRIETDVEAIALESDFLETLRTLVECGLLLHSNGVLPPRVAIAEADD